MPEKVARDHRTPRGLAGMVRRAALDTGKTWFTSVATALPYYRVYMKQALSAAVLLLSLCGDVWAQGCSTNLAACPNPRFNSVTTNVINGPIAGPIVNSTINNTPIGSTTPSTGAFTTLSASGNASVGGTLTVGGVVISGNGTAHDHSGTITAGGTAQTVIPANPTRSGCNIQALGGSDLWISISGVASIGNGSYDIPPGSVFVCPLPVSTGNISIISAVTGTPFTATEIAQ